MFTIIFCIISFYNFIFLDHVNIIMVTNLVNAINKLKDMGFYVYAAEADGVDYRKVDYADKKALVIGSEGFGLSRLVRDNSDEIIRYLFERFPY